jgi:diguanylate cyclase (GGDEF)-like protein/PAS domain S-box-containing protein
MPRKKNLTPKTETTEAALYQQQQQLAVLLTHIPAYAFFKDTHSVYIAASKMFCDALNHSQEEIIGKTDYNLVPKVLADKYHADDLRVITTGEPLYVGEENMIKSGKMITVVTRKVPLKDKTGKVIGLVGTGFDVTELKQAQTTLQESEIRYRATIDAMGDAIHVVDSKLRIILLNQSFKNWLTTLGLEPDPFGKAIFEVFPFLSKKVESEYQTVFETKQILITQETSIVNNQEIVTETRKIPILEKGAVQNVVTVVRDITEQNRTAIALQKSEETYRSLVENINDVIFTLDPQGKITYISPAIERIAGYNVSDLLDKPFTHMIHPDDMLIMLGNLEQSFAGQSNPTEFRLVDRTDVIHYMRGSSRRLIEKNHMQGLIGIMSDITDRKQVEEQLRSLSLIDELTGLYNRRGFLALAEQQIKIAHRLEKRMLLLFADIDNMKWINDTFGHQEGDRALMEITTVFKETFRESDIIARLGGDEFVILAIEIDASSAEILSQRLQENLDTHNTHATRNYRLAVSTGIARYVPESPRPLNELLEQADKLMYEQKRKKQNLQKNSLDISDKTNQY